jgi:phosphoribosylformylglycinamidine cyclo-ligase
MKQDERYQARGVSAQKDEVHQAIKHLDKGEYPRAFAKILPDVIAHGEDPSPYCNIMHADTAGTKTALAYLYWKETGDASIWRGIAQDAIMMNIDDMICVGCFDPIVLSSTIGRNKHIISQEVISEVIRGAEEVIATLKDLGLDIVSSGGETADVGDIVRTIDVGYTAFARMRRSEVLENDIRAGQKIVGLASFGQAHYETFYNSGIGSNGLTSARHDVLKKTYAHTYPEAFAPQTPSEFVFSGQYGLQDRVNINGSEYFVHELLLSPTRTYFPVLKKMMDLCRPEIHGIIHCTGGAQTKVLKFVEDVSIHKVNLFDPPPVFQLIKDSSGADWSEMYQVFNMGHRMELYVDDEVVDTLIEISKSFGIDARCIGEVTASKSYRLKIKTPENSSITF